MFLAVKWQRFEGLLIFAIGLVLYWHLADEMPWWAVIGVFFLPDLSFLGYVMGPKVGSYCYNAVHIYAFGMALFAIGLIFSAQVCVIIGALWLAHSGFDRMLGYGLKSTKGFPLTHLGQIGKSG